MLSKNLLSKLGNPEIYSPIQGGDSAKSYKVIGNGEDYFVKEYVNDQAKALVACELEGLKAIQETGVINTPKVIDVFEEDNRAGLILEYISAVRPEAKGRANFGRQLRLMHSVEQPDFGWGRSTFIGPLNQSNSKITDWSEFYLNNRILPLLKKVIAAGDLTMNLHQFIENWHQNIAPILKGVSPSLLHGDLWTGNVLFNKKQTPFLLDPSVYFGDKDVDIAMSLLFGDFGEEFYKAYGIKNVKAYSASKKIALYQLYYLLVHLALFGKSYQASVIMMLQRVMN